MPVLGKKIGKIRELSGHVSHRTQMIPARKPLIAFLDFFPFLLALKISSWEGKVLMQGKHHVSLSI